VRVEGTAKVVWLTCRVIRDQPVKEVGLQFKASVALEPVARFLDAFRFRVAVYGLPHDGVFEERVKEVARLEFPHDLEELKAQVMRSEVGLLVCKVGPQILTALLEHAEARGLPVIAVIEKMTPAVSQLLHKNPRLFCQTEPIDSTVFAALSVRVLESTTQSEESDRLTVSLERELRTLRHGTSRLEGLLGQSAAMQRVADDVERLAELDCTVLILGETGTGKGVVARAMHRISPRAKKTLITQNCAALPEALLDSELFGHVRGAFTGAVSDRPGIFESADGGTIFLDELTEMSPSMQAKLLTVLQDGEFRRVGSATTVRVDVRVICACNRPLEPLVEQGSFREDLYYRLAPFVVRLPPLRERKEDISQLTAHTLAQFRARYGGPERRLELDAMALLENAPWPGNVRQLQHGVERLAIGTQANGTITAALVHEALASPTPRVSGREGDAVSLEPGESLTDALERFERNLISAALERAHFVISDAAQALKVNRSTLSRRVRQLGIRQP
jgi:transcriptional regulator with GAF, ATPase, and Fis domain